MIDLWIKRSTNGGFVPKTKNAKEQDNIFYSPTREKLLALTHLGNVSTILYFDKEYEKTFPTRTGKYFITFKNL